MCKIGYKRVLIVGWYKVLRNGLKRLYEDDRAVKRILYIIFNVKVCHSDEN